MNSQALLVSSSPSGGLGTTKKPLWNTENAANNTVPGPRNRQRGHGLGDKFLDKLPPMSQELLLASTLGPSLYQIVQEICMQLIPKAVMSAATRPLMIGYETLLEMGEYLWLYIFPVGLTMAVAPAITKASGVPDFRLLSKHSWELKENIGKEITLGKRHLNTVKLTPEIVNRTNFAKLMMFAIVAGAGCAAQMIAVTPRVFFIDKITELMNKFSKSKGGKTNNFYEISGLPVPEGESVNGSDAKKAMQHAQQNLWWGLAYIAASTPLLIGLTKGLSGLAARQKFSPQLHNLGKVLTLDGFGLSKAVIAANLAIAPWAYTRTALNAAGAQEDLNRLLGLSIPAVLFFQALGSDLLIGLTAKGMGIKSPVLRNWGEWKEQVALGKQEFLNLSRYSEEHLKTKAEFQALPQMRQEKFLKRASFMGHYGIFGLATAWGLVLNWFNYLNTIKMHDEEMRARFASKKGLTAAAA